MATRDDDCLEAVLDASARLLSRSEAEDVVFRTKQMRDINIGKGMSTMEALRKAADDTIMEMARTAQQNRFEQLLNLQKRVGRRNDIANKIEEFAVLKGDRAKSIGEAILNMLVPTHEPVRGAYDTLSGRIRQNQELLVHFPLAQLKAKGLMHYAYDRSNGLDIAKELYALTDEQHGKPGYTKSENAKSVAEILHAAQRVSFKNYNGEGVFIHDLPGYIAQQSRDWEKVHAAGFDAWYEKEMERLDQDKTFAGRELEDPKEWMRDVWNNIVSGLHVTAGHETGFKAPTYSGPANIGKRLGQSRILIYKDPVAWHESMTEFGKYPSVTENIMAAQMRAARNLALINKFGTNPAAEFKGDIRYALENEQAFHPEAVAKFNESNWPKYLESMFKRLDGTADRPVYKLGANVVRGVLSEQMLEVGGSIPFAHFSVPVTQGSVMKYYGGSSITAYSNFLKTMIEKLDPAYRKDMLDLAMTHAEGMNSHLLSGWDFTQTGMRGGTFAQQLKSNVANKEVAGTLSTLSSGFMKAIGVHYLIDGGRMGFERMISAMLAKQLKMPYESLDALHRETLRSHNIGASEWWLLQHITEFTKDRNGLDHMTPNLVLDIPTEKIEPILRAKGVISDKASQAMAEAQASRFRDDLAMRVALYYSEGSRMATNVPGERTRQLLQGDANIGTFWGGMRYLATQFKQWPVELMMNTMARELKRNPTALAKAGGLMSLATMLTATGYMRDVAFNLSHGQEPPDPSKMATWASAAQRGGTFMLIGDMVASEIMRGKDTGKAFASLITGPSGANLAYPILDMMRKGAAGHDVSKEMKRYGMDRGKMFTNAWYANLATHYLFLNSLYDMIDPDWSRKQEANQQKYGTPYLFNAARPTQGLR